MPASLNSAALTARRRARIAQVRSVTGAKAARAWSSMRWHGETAQPEFAAKAGPVIRAGQDRAVSLTVAAIGLVVAAKPVLDRRKLLDELAPDLTSPFQAFGHALNTGQSPDDALAIGESVARMLGEDAVQHAARSSGAAFDYLDRVVGWERVPDGGACDWCLQVAEQHYKTADSAAFGHNGCGCDVEVVLA